MKTPRVAFVGWNPFQFLQFSSIIARFPEATLVVEKRRQTGEMSGLGALSPASHVLRCDRRAMEKLDGKFDVLVCQTPFHGIERIRESRLAMLQYGYAKEAHNFGAWRSFADVCMTFGPYASRKMEPFCPAVAIGNPRFERWGDPAFHDRPQEKYSGRLDPTKKTLLYAPTWGELSSTNGFAEAILGLSGDYNVIFKIHHNTQHFDARSLDSLRQRFGVIHGADDDIVELLAVSDVLLSDFSGAIFDAIYARRPVVLLGGCAPASTSDPFSIEQARREELGEIVLSPADLPAAIARTLEGTNPQAAALSILRDDLFLDAIGTTDRATEVIHQLAAGSYGPSQTQSYIRQEMAELFRCRSQFKWLRQLCRRFRSAG
jgi:hypothetical protein